MYITYADYMDEISADELFEGLLGYRKAVVNPNDILCGKC